MSTLLPIMRASASAWRARSNQPAIGQRTTSRSTRGRSTSTKRRPLSQQLFGTFREARRGLTRDKTTHPAKARRVSDDEESINTSSSESSDASTKEDGLSSESSASPPAPRVHRPKRIRRSSDSPCSSGSELDPDDLEIANQVVDQPATSRVSRRSTRVTRLDTLLSEKADVGAAAVAAIAGDSPPPGQTKRKKKKRQLIRPPEEQSSEDQQQEAEQSAAAESKEEDAIEMASKAHPRKRMKRATPDASPAATSTRESTPQADDAMTPASADDGELIARMLFPKRKTFTRKKLNRQVKLKSEAIELDSPMRPPEPDVTLAGVPAVDADVAPPLAPPTTPTTTTMTKKKKKNLNPFLSASSAAAGDPQAYVPWARSKAKQDQRKQERLTETNQPPPVLVLDESGSVTVVGAAPTFRSKRTQANKPPSEAGGEEGPGEERSKVEVLEVNDDVVMVDHASSELEVIELGSSPDTTPFPDFDQRRHAEEEVTPSSRQAPSFPPIEDSSAAGPPQNLRSLAREIDLQEQLEDEEEEEEEEEQGGRTSRSYSAAANSMSDEGEAELALSAHYMVTPPTPMEIDEGSPPPPPPSIAAEVESDNLVLAGGAIKKAKKNEQAKTTPTRKQQQQQQQQLQLKKTKRRSKRIIDDDDLPDVTAVSTSIESPRSHQADDDSAFFPAAAPDDAMELDALAATAAAAFAAVGAEGPPASNEDSNVTPPARRQKVRGRLTRIVPRPTAAAAAKVGRSSTPPEAEESKQEAPPAAVAATPSQPSISSSQPSTSQLASSSATAVAAASGAVGAPPRPSGSSRLHHDSYPVPWLNMFADEPPPTFEWVRANRNTPAVDRQVAPYQALFAHSGCQCKKGGKCRPRSCACMQKGGQYSYVQEKVQFPATSGITLFECNAQCGCGPHCGNRVVQREPYNSRLACYLFRTRDMQWGVRCADMIPAGTVISDYLGERKTEEEALAAGAEEEEEDDRDDDGADASSSSTPAAATSSAAALHDEYMFVVNTGSIYGSDMTELASIVGDLQMTDADTGERRPCRTVDEALAHWPRVTIDAIEIGTLARFINHSCQPNVTAIQVFVESRVPFQAHIVYVARDNIPAHTELLVSYRYDCNPRDGGEWPFICQCNTADCKHPLFNKQPNEEAEGAGGGEHEQKQQQQEHEQDAEQSVPAQPDEHKEESIALLPPSPPSRSSDAGVSAASSSASAPSVPSMTTTTEFIASYLSAHPELTSRTHWTDGVVLPMVAASMQLNLAILQHDLVCEFRKECKRREAEAEEAQRAQT